jgi:hypothetical protein
MRSQGNCFLFGGLAHRRQRSTRRIMCRPEEVGKGRLEGRMARVGRASRPPDRATLVLDPGSLCAGGAVQDDGVCTHRRNRCCSLTSSWPARAGLSGLSTNGFSWHEIFDSSDWRTRRERRPTTGRYNATPCHLCRARPLRHVAGGDGTRMQAAAPRHVRLRPRCGAARPARRRTRRLSRTA